MRIMITRPHSRRGIVIWLLCMYAVLIIAILISNAFQRPKSLGPQLTYIGSFSYGCLWLCDSGPSKTYYYATDMTIDEVTDYFKHGACSKVSNVSTVSADYGGSYIDCKMAGRTVNIVYYSDHPENVVKDFKLKNTGKRFVIDMPDFDYRWVKAAL